MNSRTFLKSLFVAPLAGFLPKRKAPMSGQEFVTLLAVAMLERLCANPRDASAKRVFNAALDTFPTTKDDPRFLKAFQRWCEVCKDHFWAWDDKPHYTFPKQEIFQIIKFQARSAKEGALYERGAGRKGASGAVRHGQPANKHACFSPMVRGYMAFARAG